MSVASTLAQWLGVKRVAILSTLLVAPTLALALTAHSAAMLIGGLVAYGLCAGTLDTAMNAQGVVIEQALRRPIMARLHGSASAGVAVGAILGSLIVTGENAWIAAVIAALALAAAAATIAVAAPPDPARGVGAREGVRRRVITRPLVIIGLVVGVSIASETASLAWSAPLLRSEAPWLASIAGLGGAFFAACQAALRLNADTLRKRIDDRTLISISLGVAAFGLLIAALPFGFAVSVVGFAIVGFGTGAIVPCGFALAASAPGIGSAAAISAVAFFGVFARVPAPLITGAIAEAFSLSAAFVAIAALLGLAMVAVMLFVPANPREAQS
jgi:predicted MFS family arabinose efflux permease